MPKGYDGTANLDVSYDPSYLQGHFSLYAYRYASDDPTSQELIAFYSDSIKQAGIYPLIKQSRQEGLFSDRKTGCEYLQGGQHFRDDELTITRLDIQNGTVSGLFEITLAKSGCDTVRITQGRFDMKI